MDNHQAVKQDFLKLIQQNKRIIFKICNSYCQNADDREDLAQEIVYQLWRSFSHFKPEYRYSTWMYRIALNVAISFYRKSRNSGHLIPVEDKLLEIRADYQEPDETEYNISLLQQFIHELKDLDRALMILYLEEKSYKEIAEILAITATNVATRISRIKDKLKQKFATLNQSSYGN